MLTIIFKRIWNDRRTNGWLFAELFIVFIILWYVIDFLFGTLYAGQEYKGYDTNHVYHISIDANPTLYQGYTGTEAWSDAFMQIFRIIKEYPGIESACYYGGTVPYEWGSMFQGYTVDSTHIYRANISMVNKDYFDVFKVKLIEADLRDWDMAGYPRPAVLSCDLADSLFNNHPQVGDSFRDYYSPEKYYKTGGITPRIKQSEYERYEPTIYVPVEDWMLHYSTPTVAVRIRPQSEYGFTDRFMSDMRETLNIGPFYLSQIRSYDEAKEIHDTNINNYIRTSLAIMLFFIFNVFLGIMGTFWFRTRKRRGEIGLRLALGAASKTISKELICESIIILMLAAIPAIIICFNIWLLEITVNTLMDPTGIRLTAGLVITLTLMMLMVIAGVWYPANRAMKVQPADALHEE